MTAPIKLASRRSKLALAQSGMIAEQVAERTGREVVIVEVVSEGDRNRAPLTTIGGSGVFVAAVRDAIIEGRADIAVHSLKDLPTAAAPGLRIGAVPSREDPRDVLVCASPFSLSELPSGSQVGTGSPRRAAQIRRHRPDLKVVDIRGNLDSRLARIKDDLDAVVLAAAGIARLGVQVPLVPLHPTEMLPAPGQGALAVEVATTCTDDQLLAALADLDDPLTRACVTAERTLLATLEAGCSAPVGALAVLAEAEVDSQTPADQRITLTGGVFGTEHDYVNSATHTPSHAVKLGIDLAQQLLASGAAGALSEGRHL